MTEHKERTEFALEAKMMPLDVVMECLSLREQRVSTDLVRDEVEEELHKVTGIKGVEGLTLTNNHVELMCRPLTNDHVLLLTGT